MKGISLIPGLIVLLGTLGPARAAAQWLDFNMPGCADVLLARPPENLLPRARETVRRELERAIAQLRKEVPRLASIPPRPILPAPPVNEGDMDQFIADLGRHGDQLRAYLAHLESLTPEEKDYYRINMLITDFEELAAVVGKETREDDVEAFQLDGEDAVQAYLGRLSAAASLTEFEPVLRELRPSARSWLAALVEPAEVAWRRRRAEKTGRADWKSDILYPQAYGHLLARKLNAYWSAGARIYDARAWDPANDLGRAFLDAFVPDPHPAHLGWNGRGDVAIFIRRRRAEIMRDQIRRLAEVNVKGYTDTSGWADAVIELRSHCNWEFEVHWIPGWSEIPDGREPRLTVITRFTRHSTPSRGGGGGRRRTGESASPTPDPWLAGGLAPSF